MPSDFDGTALANVIAYRKCRNLPHPHFVLGNEIRNLKQGPLGRKVEFPACLVRKIRGASWGVRGITMGHLAHI